MLKWNQKMIQGFLLIQANKQKCNNVKKLNETLEKWVKWHAWLHFLQSLKEKNLLNFCAFSQKNKIFCTQVTGQSEFFWFECEEMTKMMTKSYNMVIIPKKHKRLRIFWLVTAICIHFHMLPLYLSILTRIHPLTEKLVLWWNR